MMHCTWTLKYSSLIQAPRIFFLWARKEKVQDMSSKKKSKVLGSEKKYINHTTFF